MPMPERTIFQIVSFWAMESPIPFPSAFRCRMLRRRSREVHEEEFLGDGQNSTGLGDSIFLGKYKFYDKQFGLAGIFGLKLPTGNTNERNMAGERFEPELQPGTGSLDYMAGISANKKINHLIILDGTVLYHLKTKR